MSKTPRTDRHKYYERHGQCYVVQAAYHADLERELNTAQQTITTLKDAMKASIEALNGLEGSTPGDSFLIDYASETLSQALKDTSVNTPIDNPDGL